MNVKKVYKIIMQAAQYAWFIGIFIETLKGDIQKCTYYLLWILVIEFVLKDKDDKTIIKSDAIYLNGNVAESMINTIENRLKNRSKEG